MSFAHMTLPTQHVEATAQFIEDTLRYKRKAVPTNSPVELVWFDIGNGQELHVFYVEDFACGPHEAEFGRHVALFHPLADFPALRERVQASGGELIEPLRVTPFERFFFREPVNGYLFEVIDPARHTQILAELQR
jgi:predicted enzyme related to lactoylglutathione lyase